MLTFTIFTAFTLALAELTLLFTPKIVALSPATYIPAKP
jgi:flagellar biosynthesis protein FliQ